MTYNKDLLKELQAWTTGETPDGIELDMGIWFNGDQACLGGWAVHRSGGQIFEADITLPDEVSQSIPMARIDSETMEPSSAAGRLLGLDWAECSVLFDLNQEEETPDRSLAFLVELVERSNKGLANMTEAEVEEWQKDWVGAW